MALSLCLIHGVYPRPNAVGHPLDVMEKIWRITDRFGIADAEFTGYWDQPALQADRDGVYVSCYTREQLDGTRRMLILAGNPSPEPAGIVEVRLPANQEEWFILSAYDALRGEMVEKLTGEYPAYGLKIYEVVLSKR